MSDGAWVRNGDRWRVTGRGADGNLAVDHVGGRGGALLPPEYVKRSVALAYAVTVHSAQGMTVDRCVAVLEPSSSAELVYVAMTRGRLANHALVVCEHDDEHRHKASPTPVEVLAGCLRRPGAERSATEVLRDELERSESLATLMPLLVQARAHLDAYAGPDRRPELPALRQAVKDEPLRRAVARNAEVLLAEAQRATARARAEMDQAVERANDVEHRRHRLFRRPGAEERHGARVGLDAARGQLARAEQEETHRREQRDCLALPAVSAAEALERGEVEVERRDHWLDEHPTEAAWEQALAERVSERRDDLGQGAVERQPRHVVQLLGQVPSEVAAQERWQSGAAAIEAYRERWGLPDAALDGPAIGGRAEEWTNVQRAVEKFHEQRCERSLADRPLNHDLGLSL